MNKNKKVNVHAIHKANVLRLTDGIFLNACRNISKKYLAQKSIYFEQKIMNEIVGSQDQIAASYGGFNKITNPATGRKVSIHGKIGQSVLKKYVKELYKN